MYSICGKECFNTLSIEFITVVSQSPENIFV